MNIKVIGTGCEKCDRLYANVQEALKITGCAAEVEKIEDLWEEFPDNDFYYLTTKTQNYYTNVKFKDGDFLVFGPESRGIPEDLLISKGEKAITIPMQENQRSLNLSNSVAIVVYEALRQINTWK